MLKKLFSKPTTDALPVENHLVRYEIVLKNTGSRNSTETKTVTCYGMHVTSSAYVFLNQEGKADIIFSKNVVSRIERLASTKDEAKKNRSIATVDTMIKTCVQFPTDVHEGNCKQSLYDRIEPMMKASGFDIVVHDKSEDSDQVYYFYSGDSERLNNKYQNVLKQRETAKLLKEAQAIAKETDYLAKHTDHNGVEMYVDSAGYTFQLQVSKEEHPELPFDIWTRGSDHNESSDYRTYQNGISEYITFNDDGKDEDTGRYDINIVSWGFSLPTE